MRPPQVARKVGSRSLRALAVTRKHVRRGRKRLHRSAFSRSVRKRWERATKRFLWQPALRVITSRGNPRDRLLRSGPPRDDSADLSRVRMKR